MVLFSVETTSGDILSVLSRISNIIKAKGDRVNGSRIIFIEVDNGKFRLYVQNIEESIPQAIATGKGKISINFIMLQKLLKTYPKTSVLKLEAFPEYLLLNGSMQFKEQYCSNR